MPDIFDTITPGGTATAEPPHGDIFDHLAAAPAAAKAPPPRAPLFPPAPAAPPARIDGQDITAPTNTPKAPIFAPPTNPNAVADPAKLANAVDAENGPKTGTYPNVKPPNSFVGYDTKTLQNVYSDDIRPGEPRTLDIGNGQTIQVGGPAENPSGELKSGLGRSNPGVDVVGAAKSAYSNIASAAKSAVEGVEQIPNAINDDALQDSEKEKDELYQQNYPGRGKRPTAESVRQQEEANARTLGNNKKLAELAQERREEKSAAVDTESKLSEFYDPHINPNDPLKNIPGKAAGAVIDALATGPAAPGVMALNAYGGAMNQGNQEGWTPEQKLAIAATRGAFAAVLGLIPGGKLVPVKGPFITRAIVSALEAKGIGLSQAVVEDKLREKLGLDYEGTLQTLANDAKNGDSNAQAALFGLIGGLHGGEDRAPNAIDRRIKSDAAPKPVDGLAPNPAATPAAPVTPAPAAPSSEITGTFKPQHQDAAQKAADATGGQVLTDAAGNHHVVTQKQGDIFDKVAAGNQADQEMQQQKAEESAQSAQPAKPIVPQAEPRENAPPEPRPATPQPARADAEMQQAAAEHEAAMAAKVKGEKAGAPLPTAERNGTIPPVNKPEGAGRTTPPEQNPKATGGKEPWEVTQAQFKKLPGVLYHGTQAAEDFTTFKPKSYGTAGEHSYFYFSDSPKVIDRMRQGGAMGDVSPTHRVIPAIVDVKKPLDLRGNDSRTPKEWVGVLRKAGVDVPESFQKKVDAAENPKVGRPAWKMFRNDTGPLRDAIIKAGYDGIKWGEWGADTTAAFHPEQIKTHRDVVEQALRDGKTVPPAVLKDYPDLAKKYADKTSAPPPPAEASPVGGKAETPAPPTPKPNTVGSMKTSDIHVDPDRFQYKLDTNEKGVGSSLGDVKEWNPTLAGTIGVWTDPADGKTYAVNGHHRHELAERAGVENMNVLHYAAKNAEEARAIGALANIAEGKGTPIDAAKFFRDTKTTPEELQKRGLSMRESTVSQGRSLAKLSDEAFNAVVQGKLSTARGVALGELLGDKPEAQKGLMQAVEGLESRGKEVTDRAFRKMAQNASLSQQGTKEVASLWGTDSAWVDTQHNRAEISGAVEDALARSARTFSFVSDEGRAGKIAEGGVGKIDTAKGGAAAKAAAESLELFRREENKAGSPVAAALSDLAKQVGDDKLTLKQAKEQAHERIKNALLAAEQGTTGPAVPAGPARGGAESRGEQAGEESSKNQPAEVTPPKPKFGESNRIVTRDEADKIIRELGDNSTLFTNPIPLDKLVKVAKLGAFYVEGGARSFADFSAKMIEQFGEKARPHLQQIYDHIRGDDQYKTLHEGMDGIKGASGPQESILPKPEPGADPDTTGIKNAVSAADRERLGLPPRNTPQGRSFDETYERGKSAIAADPQAEQRMLNQLRANPEKILGTDAEAGIMLKHKVDLENELHRLRKDLTDAQAKGDETAIKDTQLQLDLHRSVIKEFTELAERTGTATGRALAARKMMSAMDYSLSHMETMAESAKGSKLTRAELEQVGKQYEAIKAKNEELQKHLDTANERAATAEAERDHANLLREAAEKKAKSRTVQIVDPNAPKNTAQKAAPLTQRLTAKLNKLEEAAIARIKARGTRVNALGALDPGDFADRTIIGAVEISKLGVKAAEKFGEWSKAMVSRFDESIKPHLQELWFAAQKKHAEIEAETARDELIERMKARVTDDAAKPQDLQQYFRKLALDIINSGVKKREPLLDALHEQAKKVFPDIKREEVRDALSGYGEYTRLNPAEDHKTLRDINQQSQKLAQLEALQKGQAPKKTGVERQSPNDETRALTKQVNEAKKAAGIVTTDPATQLKTTLDAMKTRAKNTLSDLQTEIDTKQRIVKGKAVPISDAELDTLKKQVAEKRKEHAEIFDKPGMSDEQKLAAATAAAKANMESWQSRLAEAKKGNFAKPDAGTKLSNPEIDAMRAQAVAARAEYDQLEKMANPPKTNSEIREKAIQKNIDAIDAKIKSGNIEATNKTKLGPDPAGVDALKKTRDALNKQLADMRKNAKPSTPESVAKEKGLNKQIQALSDRIDNGELEATKIAKQGPPTEEVDRLTRQREALVKQLADMRDNDPVIQARKAAEAATAAADEYERKAKEGEFTKTPGKAPPAPTPEMVEANARKELAKAEYQKLRDADPDYQRQQNEADNRSLRAQLARREADYKDRLARGDFAPRPKAAARQLDPATLKLQAEAERAKNLFELGLKKHELATRKTWEKGMDLIAKIGRFNVLSGIKILGKLADATGLQVLAKPIDDIAGSAIRHVPGISKIAAKAPSEGGAFSPLHFGRAVTRAATKGFADAYKTLTDPTHQSDLKALYDKGKIAPGWLEFNGVMHSAIKSPLLRFGWEYSMERRAAFAAKNGINPADPAIAHANGLAAYSDALRLLFQEKNALSEGYQNMLSRWEQKDKNTGSPSVPGKIGATVARVINPVPVIGTNLVKQAFTRSGGGLLAAPFEVRSAFKRGLDSLPPEQADKIMRHLKQGSVGVAALLLGMYGSSNVGGFWKRNDKRDNNDVPADNIRIFGHDVGERWQHHPLLMAMQAGATFMRELNKGGGGADTAEYAASGASQAAIGLVTKAPHFQAAKQVVQGAEQPGSSLAKVASTLLVPQVVKEIAQETDKPHPFDPFEDTTKRKPKGFVDQIKSNIPGLRQQVPQR